MAGREAWWVFVIAEYPQHVGFLRVLKMLNLEEVLCDQQMQESKTIMFHL